jgi:abortive infection bacteriophage resistance protein
MKYDKIPLTVEEHIVLLKKRGLLIEDEERAKKYLHNISYFRLTGYMIHVQSRDGEHTFKEGTTFNQIINIYQFDKKLRAIVLEYMERIEVALRAKLTNKFSLSHGFYWYTEYDLYDDKNIYTEINERIKEAFIEAQERFLKSFQLKYTSESLPPSNMALETVTLGKLARLYRGLSNKDEKMEIAKEFGVQSPILSSWLVYLTNVRNICAHHCRLWNRRVTADMPIVPTRKKNKFNGTVTEDFHKTMYGVIGFIDKLLHLINPDNAFTQKITQLIDEYSVDVAQMGFPKDWRENAVWLKREEPDEKMEVTPSNGAI